MKEAIFRGYSECEKKWIYGYLIEKNGAFYILEKVIGMYSKSRKNSKSNSYDGLGGRFRFELHLVDKKSISRYTGFYDANKNPIYEGDFVTSAIFKKGPVYQIVYDKYKGWCRKLYRIKTYEPAFTIADPSENYMIVGNIYQNPEFKENRLYKHQEENHYEP